jgi:hypothetical protein
MQGCSMALWRTARVATGVLFFFAALVQLFVVAQSYRRPLMVMFPVGEDTACAVEINRGAVVVRVNVPLPNQPFPSRSSRRLVNSVQVYHSPHLELLDERMPLDTHVIWEFHGAPFLPPLHSFFPGIRTASTEWFQIRATHVAFSPVYPFAIVGLTAVAGVLLLRKHKLHCRGRGFPIVARQAEQ